MPENWTLHRSCPDDWVTHVIDGGDETIAITYGARFSDQAGIERDAWHGHLLRAGPDLIGALDDLLRASDLTPGDCYTNGKPNENWGAIDRAKKHARDLVAALRAKEPLTAFPITAETTSHDTHVRWTALNQGQSPDGYQARLMELVKDALAAGLFYNTDVNKHVREHSVGFIPDEAWAWQYKSHPVEHGIVGHEIYSARQAIEAEKDRLADAEAVKRYPAGTKLGTLLVNGKRYTSVVVKEFSGRDGVYLIGKAGSRSVTLVAAPRYISSFIEGAVKRGWRKA